MDFHGHAVSVPPQKNPLGPTGRAVADNVRRLRGEMSIAELARRLDQAGRRIPVLGLSQVERGERRVDADDLVALAQVLGVSPATLLMPEAREASEAVSLAGSEGEVSARAAWDWLTAEWPLSAEDAPEGKALFAFRQASVPGWAHTSVSDHPVLLQLQQVRNVVRSALDDPDPEKAYVGLPAGRDPRTHFARWLRYHASSLPPALEMLAEDVEAGQEPRTQAPPGVSRAAQEAVAAARALDVDRPTTGAPRGDG